MIPLIDEKCKSYASQEYCLVCRKRIKEEDLKDKNIVKLEIIAIIIITIIIIIIIIIITIIYRREKYSSYYTKNS